MYRIFTNRRLLSIAIILIASNLLITGISIFVVYKKAIQSVEASLIDIVERQKTLVTILHQQGKEDADIIQLIQTMRAKRYSIGKAGEFAIAQQVGDSVKYLLALGANPNFKQNINQSRGLPMQLALSGKNGFVKANDYQDNLVFAAYTFIPQLNWGIVAKIPATEVNRPYYEAILLTFLISVFIIVICLLLFIRFSNPIVKSIIESEEKYRQAIQNAPFPIMIHSETGNVLAISQGWSDISGYDFNDIPTIEKWTGKAYGESKQIVLNEIDKLYALKGRKEDGEYTITCKDGSKRIWDFSSSSLGRLADGRRAVISMAKDVTERKQNEQQLQEQKEEIEAQNKEYQQIIEELQLTKNSSLENQLNYFQLFENMEQGFALHEMIYDELGNPVDYRFILINKAFERLTNINAADYIGKTVKEVLPNTENTWIETYGRVAQTGESLHFENYSNEFKKYYDVIAYSPTKNHFAVVFTDNTERRNQEIIIQQNNTRLKILLGLSQMVELDADQIFNYALEKSTELCNSKIGFLGFLNEQETIVTIHAWSDSAMEMCEIKDKYIDFEVAKTGIWGEVIRQRKPLMINDFKADNPLKRGLPQGHIEINNYMSLPIFDNGKIVAVIAVGNKPQDYNETDIHELTLFVEGVWNVVKQRKYEKELIIAKEKAESNEEKIKNIINLSPSIISTANLNSTYFVSVSPAVTRILGYTIEEFTSMPIMELIHLDDRQRTIDEIEIQLKGQETTFFENRYLCKNGSYKWLAWHATKADKNGIVIAIATDINERKYAEIELVEAKEHAEESKQKYKRLFTNMMNAFGLHEMIFNEKGEPIDYIFLEVNPIWENVVGIKADNVIGKRIREIMPDIEQNWLDRYGRIVLTGISEEFVDYNAATQKYYNVSAYKHEGNKFAVVFNDITDKKQFELDLMLAKEKAEESDRLKTAFLQNMSHEIRTPMNAIMGFSELLVSNFNNKPKLENFSHIINQRCNDLLVIIEDILDIAKIESGQLKVTIENCNLNSLFSELQLFFAEQQLKLQKQHIQLSLKAQCDPNGANILTDKVKLKQIFINLVGNAFKFTDSGLIEGGCHFDNSNNLIFFVSDTGIGIQQEKQQLIFERFAQVEQSTSRLYGGTGIGLSIVKGLVELLGGRIWLESEFGRGSTFYFSIPHQSPTLLVHEPMIIEEKAIQTFLPDKTILIVEDDTYNAAFIKEILSKTGLNLLYAQYGNEAVQIASAQPIDLILMDIGLPDITGYEATRQIKQQKPALKIIAQTAYAASDDKQKALEAGCIDYISKPLKSKMLLSLLNKHLS